MKSLMGLALGVMVASTGTVWAGQATEHDHAHDAGAPATAGAAQIPAALDAQGMSKMQKDMMARISAFDDQVKALGVEMNAAKTTDAKLAAVTKLLNVFIEQRTMMRTQMDAQSKMMEQMTSMHQTMQHMMAAPPAGSTTPPGTGKAPH
jgi:hypothetical protein